MVDVTGFEPATPCLQSRPGKTLNSFVGVAYTETSEIPALPKYPEVVPNPGGVQSLADVRLDLAAVMQR